jgi:hypothetical protein
MKRYSRLIVCIPLLIFSFCILPQFAMAQPDPEGDPDAPIDGGVGILVAAGVIYGMKKIKENKRKENKKEID